MSICKHFSIYQFQNLLYYWYKIISIYKSKNKVLYIQMPITSNNILRRAIGEEVSDFLQYNKDIVIY